MPHAGDRDGRDIRAENAVDDELDDVGTRTVRIEALSDAIFGVALTLLVLEIRLPETEGLTASAFAAQLLGVAPKLFAYVLTFVTVGQYWIIHRQMMDLIVRFDLRVLWLNFIFLFFISLLPFPTSFVTRSGWLPWAIYAMNFVLLGVSKTLMWRYALTHKMVDRRVTPNLAHFLTMRGLVGPVVFLLSIPVVFIHSSLAAFALLLIWPLNMWVTRAHKHAGAVARSSHE